MLQKITKVGIFLRYLCVFYIEKYFHKYILANFTYLKNSAIKFTILFKNTTNYSNKNNHRYEVYSIVQVSKSQNMNLESMKLRRK